MKKQGKKRENLFISQFNPFKWFNHRLLRLAMSEPFTLLKWPETFFFPDTGNVSINWWSWRANTLCGLYIIGQNANTFVDIPHER